MNRDRRIMASVAKRNKLMTDYAANKRERLKLQHNLDRLTCRIARLTGLEPALYAAGGLFDPLRRERE